MRTNLQLLILLLLLLFSGAAGARQQPKRLKLGYSIAITAITPQKLTYAKSAGIDYIEVSMNPLVGKNREFKLSDAQLLARAKQAKKAADDAGIKVWSVHMPYAKDVDLSLLKEAERLQVVALHQKVLTYCKILQPEIVLFHPSYYLGLNEREMRIKQLVKSVATLNRTVKQIGSTMVVENMLGFELLADAKRERPLCRTVEETRQVMDLLPADVYSAIDMNHIRHPENLILAMGKRLRSVHIADGTGKQENHYFPCSGQGQNNWVAILKALDQAGYTGPFMYESAYKDVKDMKPCYDSLYQNLLQSDKTDSILIAKNFPLLLQLEKNGTAEKALLKNKQLQQILTAQRERVKEAISSCKTVSCYAEAIKWSQKEINEIGNELIRLKIKGLDRDTAVLRRYWNNCALGINRIFDVYISSKAPRYPKIDSISFKRGDTLFLAQVQQQLRHKMAAAEQHPLFFVPALRSAIYVLKLNGRDEAARYEPLNSGLNAAPFRKAGHTDWKAFKYSMILVPGLGPEVPGMALDPNGAKRCEAAVLRYKQGLAPFIVVSGGQVHPFRTPFNEAVEMKKYLVEKLGIPEDVVFIEPHARHTTTNIRNASRMIFRFGMPADKPVLIVTDTSQGKYIVERMGKTAMRDLGYLPYKNLVALGPEDTVFYPIAQSQEPDPFDPLDP